MGYCKVSGCRFSSTHTTSVHKCGKCGVLGHGQIECGHTGWIEKLKQMPDEVIPVENHCTNVNCTNKWTHLNISHNCTFCGKNGHDLDTCSEYKVIYKIECPLCMTLNEIPSNQKKIFGLEDKCKVCKDNEVNVFLPNCGHGCLCMDCVEELNLNKIDVVEQDDIENPIDSNMVQDILAKFGEKDGKIFTVRYAGMGCQWYIRRSGKNDPLEGFFMHNDAHGQYGANTDDTPKLIIFINNYMQI